MILRIGHRGFQAVTGLLPVGETEEFSLLATDRGHCR